MAIAASAWVLYLTKPNPLSRCTLTSSIDPAPSAWKWRWRSTWLTWHNKIKEVNFVKARCFKLKSYSQTSQHIRFIENFNLQFNQLSESKFSSQSHIHKEAHTSKFIVYSFISIYPEHPGDIMYRGSGEASKRRLTSGARLPTYTVVY